MKKMELCVLLLALALPGCDEIKTEGLRVWQTTGTAPYSGCKPIPPKDGLTTSIDELRERERALEAIIADCNARLRTVAAGYPKLIIAPP